MELDDPTPPPAAGEKSPPPQPSENSNPTPLSKRKRENSEEEEEEEEGEGASRDPYWKTSLCSFHRRPGKTCSHGSTCRYAHGEDELVPLPDGSLDPTSNKAKNMLLTNNNSDNQDDDGSNVDEVLDENSMDKCLLGLPKNWNSDKFKSFLEEKGIVYNTAKKKKGMTVGFLNFDCYEQVKTTLEVLKKNPSGGKRIKVADANRRSHVKKPTHEVSLEKLKETTTNMDAESEEQTLLTSSCLIEDEESSCKSNSMAEKQDSKMKSARDVATPLAHLPYKDQLEHKKTTISQILKRLTRNARKACPNGVPLPEWILKSREICGLPCQLEGILESPVTNGYRNKCEFSVGYSLQGKKTVGFMLGNFREGITAVEEPISCPNVSAIACKYALLFQEFLESSSLPIWNRIDNCGFWRQFTVREGRRHPDQFAELENSEIQIAEVMLIIQVCSSGIDKELMEHEFGMIVQALARGASGGSPPLPLTSIVVQDHVGVSNVAPTDCPLIPLHIPDAVHFYTGEPDIEQARIHDYICDLCFSISPTAFFQVNTLAAEKLYSLAGDWADLNQDTLLFDICCGTGTIGLTLARRVGMVVGIEMNESAVTDARRNAEINGIKNCNFVCGKAEDVIGALLKQYADAMKLNDENTDVDECATQEADNTVNSATHEADNTVNSAPDGVHHSISDMNKEPPCLDGDPISEAEVDNNSEGLVRKDLENHSSEQVVTGLGRSSKWLTKCTTGSTYTTLEHSETRDTVKEENKEFKKEKVAHTQKFKKVVAIVDPPRGGLHPTVIKALRTNPLIRRLVYISCNPESLVANAIELCTPTSDKQEKSKGNRGWRNMSSAGLARQRTKSMPNSEPFRPVKAMAVDLFPHTVHCEMVMLLQR